MFSEEFNLPELEKELYVGNDQSVLKKQSKIFQYDEDLSSVDSSDQTDVKQPPSLFVVMEYMDSDLRKQLLNAGMSTQFDSDAIIQIAINSLKALTFLHEQVGIVHRDIKCANLLIDKDCNVKICDFGLARVVHKDI